MARGCWIYPPERKYMQKRTRAKWVPCNHGAVASRFQCRIGFVATRGVQATTVLSALDSTAHDVMKHPRLMTRDIVGRFIRAPW